MNENSKYLSIMYQFRITGELKKKLSESQLKKTYKSLLDENFFNGFSQIQSIEVDNEPHTIVTVSSRDVRLTFNLTNEDFEITVKNDMKSPEQFNYGWDELSILFDQLAGRTSNFLNNMASISLAVDRVILSEKEPEDIAKKIFTAAYASHAFGYSAKFMYHLEDRNLNSGHIHSFLEVHNGYIRDKLSKTFSTLSDKLNSYILIKRYDYDIHDDEGLEFEDTKDFLQKYIVIAKQELAAKVEELRLESE